MTITILSAYWWCWNNTRASCPLTVPPHFQTRTSTTFLAPARFFVDLSPILSKSQHRSRDSSQQALFHLCSHLRSIFALVVLSWVWPTETLISCSSPEFAKSMFSRRGPSHWARLMARRLQTTLELTIMLSPLQRGTHLSLVPACCVTHSL